MFFSGMGRRGFTLLEVMIALAVAGAMLVTLLYTLNHHLDVAGRHESITVATVLARTKLDEVRTGAATGLGNFPEPYSGYMFKAEKSPSPVPDVSEITVTVTSGKEQVTLRELLRPTGVVR